MKKHSSKALSKKIMLSLMVAGVMSSYAAGVAGATSITESYTALGPVDLEQILVSNGTVELMHGGTVSHEMQSGDLEERTVLITGKQGSLTAKDVTFFGDMRAMEGASITLNGGTIIAGPYYEFDGTRDGNTEVGAFDTGSTINLNGVDIKCFVNAQDGGKVIVTNSDISTGEGEGIGAEHGGKIEVSGANNTYSADYILADDKGSIKVNSGKVQLEQVLVSGGGTVELLGGGTVEHAFTQEEPEMVRVEGAGSSLTAKDVDFAGYVEAMDGASITLNGGSVLAGPGYGDVYATGEDSSITATNTDFTGDVYAADGASVTLNGGSVTAVVSFDGGGNPEYAYNTALFAEGEGATMSATGVDIKSAVFAVNGGKVTIIDSDITKTNDEISADRANSSIVISSSDGSNVYAVEKIRVDEGGSVTINSGKVQAEQVLVTNGGKVELLGGGSIKHVMTAEDPDDTMVHVNGAGSSLIAKDVDFTGDVRAVDGASITLTGGSVIAGPYYTDGEPDGGTEIASLYEGTVITATDVDIQSAVSAKFGGKIAISDSTVTTDEGIWAYNGSEIEISKTTITTNTVADPEAALGDIVAEDGSKITFSDSDVTTKYGIYADGEGSSITATNTKITGGIGAEEGASVTLTGGSVIAGPYYKADGVNFDGYTSLYASQNSSTTATGVDIQSAVNAYGGKVTIIDSDINTEEDIWAESDGSLIISSTDGNNTYTAKDIVAMDGGSVTVNSGKVALEQVYVDRNGTVELLGGGTVEHIATLENPDDRTVRVDGAGSSLKAKDVKFTGDIKAVNGGSISLTGGSVIAGPYYEEDKDGNLYLDGGTEFAAVGTGSAITADSVDIQSAVFAQYGGNITIINSDINTEEGIWAEDGTVTISSAKGDNTYTANEIVAIGSGKIYLNGGTLQADNLREMTHGIEDEETGGYIDSAKGGIVLASDGKISTMTDQIFDTAAYDAAKDTVTDGEKVKVDNTAIDYQGGTLIFNDAKYTLEYLANAKSALLNYQSNEQESFASNTVISMKGDLVGTDGKELTNTTVDAITSVLGEGTVLEKVTVTAGQNLLVGTMVSNGTEVAKIEIGHSVECGFGAADLHLGIGSDGVVITNGSKVTLVGRGDGKDIIKVLDGTTGEAVAKAVQVIVGTVEDITGISNKTGIFNIGSADIDKGEEKVNQLTGSVTVNTDSTLNTTGQTTITGGVTLNGAELNVNGELNADINVGGTSTIIGKVIADKLEAAKDSIINIGKNSKLGNLIANKIKLSGGTIFLDPVWTENGTISDASGLAVVDIDALDGNYIVGRNSLLSLGAERADAEDVFQETGLTWGENGISAAAYIADNIYVEKNGSLVVNGALAAPTAADAGSVSFADNSLLMVNGAKIYGEEAPAAINGVTSATIDDGAKLQIANASQDGTYKILAGKNIGTGWLYDEEDKTKQNVGFTNQLMGVKEIVNKGDYFNVIGESLSVRNKYGNAVVIADVIDDARANYPDSAAADFFNSAVDSTVNATDAQQISALNNAAAMSELAGVSHATYSASNIMSNAVADHMSLAKGLEHDTDIWAHYVHTKENIDGLAAGNGGAVYDAQYNGIVVGADLYKQGKGTIGAALTYIDGKVTGSTKNEAEYYGLSIYGGVQNEDSAVIGDISYLHGKNEITQNNSGYTLTGEPKSDAFSVGVRAEQSFKAGAGKVVPYAGLRYMHLGTGNYTNSIGLSYDADDANLFLLPVGVKYSAEHKAAGWTLRPIVEVGYVWAMGDRDGQQTVSLNGTSNGFGYDVTDSGSYIGRFVLEAEKANVTYGLGYEYQKGDSVKANKWMVNLNWNF